jgi:hypothetical protein
MMRQMRNFHNLSLNEECNPKTAALFMYHLLQLSMDNQSTCRLRDIER